MKMKTRCFTDMEPVKRRRANEAMMTRSRPIDLLGSLQTQKEHFATHFFPMTGFIRITRHV
jgi:hypothetical protein